MGCPLSQLSQRLRFFAPLKGSKIFSLGKNRCEIRGRILVAFWGWFGGVLRMVWWRFERGLTAFWKCSADNSSVFVAWIAHSYAIQCPTNRQPKGLQMFWDFEGVGARVWQFGQRTGCFLHGWLGTMKEVDDSNRKMAWEWICLMRGTRIHQESFLVGRWGMLC